jgi:molybdopterin synthase catalytic subunit
VGVSVFLAATAVSPAAELEAFLQDRTSDGAVATFTGLVRATGHDGQSVGALKLDAYPALTERSMQEIGEAAAARFGLTDVLIVHRSGEVSPGAAVVFVAAAAPHRREAFEGVDYLMDRLKTDAAFWKSETGPSGPRRIEPAPRDAADRARWSD